MSLGEVSTPSEFPFDRSFDLLDFPPHELLAKPMPCVALTGLNSEKISVHKAIAEMLVNGDKRSDRPPINYVTRPVNHEYPKAKPKKTSYEWYVPKGILKSFWMRKHLEEVPAVVVVFYDLDWVADPQWREKQADCQNLVRAIQMNLTGRNTKIVLVVIQEGSSLPPGGDAISEERCASLCHACGLQLQNSLFILQNNEQLHGCCLKLESRLFELAQHYYMMETRKIKEHREFVNKTTHQLLFVRHHFKTGFLSEFFRPPDGVQAALRSYRQAFGHLMDVRTTDYNLREIKVIAGFISYKIWSLSLIPGSNASQRDAEAHFRKLIEWLRPRIGPEELAFEHYAWLASQYRLFADLFAEAVRSNGFTASVSQHPGVYYHQAALITRERRKAILSVQMADLPKPGTILANGIILLEGQPPQLALIPQAGTAIEYYGQRSWRPGYQSLEPPDASTESVGIAGLQHIEKTSVDHSSIVTQLLSLAGVHFRKLGASRMCTRLSWETANELLGTVERVPKNASVALSLLKTVLNEYRQDHWVDLLKQSLLCQLGCPRLDYEEFDDEFIKELASICFELAAIHGAHQQSALTILISLITYSKLIDANELISKSLYELWNKHIEIADSRRNSCSLDVSAVGPRGFVQAWAHFPSISSSLDELPVTELFVNKIDLRNLKCVNLKITSAGVNLRYFYYYHKSKSASGSSAALSSSSSLHRGIVKTTDVTANEFLGTSASFSDIKAVHRFTCDLSKEDAKTNVAASITKNPSAKSNDSTAGAYVSISGWWVEVDVAFGDNTGTLRLHWNAGEEPVPTNSITPLTGKGLVKFQRKNTTPVWISNCSLNKFSGSHVSQGTSPFLCQLKPLKANVELEVCHEAMAALVGESFPVSLKIKNKNAEAPTSDLSVEISVFSSSPQNPHTVLTGLDEKTSSKQLAVKIPSIEAAGETTVKAFLVKQMSHDVLNVGLKLSCDSSRADDCAVVEVVRHSFSLPVVSPFSLIESALLDFDTLTVLNSYNPFRPNVLSVKLCSSSPHELHLVSMKLKMESGDFLSVSEENPQWPRRLLSGASVVEAFNIPPSTFPPIIQDWNSYSLGSLVLQWRRAKALDSSATTETVIPLPEMTVQNSAVVIRTTELPARAVLFQPCTIYYSIRNISSTTLNLRASMQAQSVTGNDAFGVSSVLSGPCEMNITLLSGASISLPISFVPMLSGFVPLPRLRVSAVASTSPPDQLHPADTSDIYSPKKHIFVQTAPNIEWLVPSNINSGF